MISQREALSRYNERYGWDSTDQSKKLRENAVAVDLSLAVKKTATSGARRKRKQEEEEHKVQAEVQVNECSLDLTYDVVARALSFFDVCVSTAARIGRQKFRTTLSRQHLTTLTAVAIASVLAHALPARPGAFISVKRNTMRPYLDSVLKEPTNWLKDAPASIEFKNRNTTTFTHEALCLPPAVCRVLRDYDDFVAPPPQSEADFFFRNTSGQSVYEFASTCSRIMRLWADKIPGTAKGTNKMNSACKFCVLTFKCIDCQSRYGDQLFPEELWRLNREIC
jgi:hypothetical protein